jgi:hypothetical protein
MAMLEQMAQRLQLPVPHAPDAKLYDVRQIVRHLALLDKVLEYLMADVVRIAWAWPGQFKSRTALFDRGLRAMVEYSDVTGAVLTMTTRAEKSRLHDFLFQDEWDKGNRNGDDGCVIALFSAPWHASSA